MLIDSAEIKRWATLTSKVLPSVKFSKSLDKAVVFRKVGDHLTMLANSGYSAIIVHGVEFEDDMPDMDFGVDANSLAHACNASGDQIKFAVNLEDSVLRISSGTNEFNLDLEDVTHFTHPSLSSDESKFSTCGKIKKGDLVNLLKKASPFLGSDIDSPHLMSVFLFHDFLYATDIIKAVRFENTGYSLDTPINFVPSGVLSVLASGGTDDTEIEIMVNDDWVMFVAGPIEFFTKRYGTSGEFNSEALDTEIDSSVKQLDTKVGIEIATIQKAFANLKYFAKEFVRIVFDRKGSRLETFTDKKVTAKASFTCNYRKAESLSLTLDIAQVQTLLSVPSGKTIDLHVGTSKDTIGFFEKNASYIFIPALEE